MIARSLREAPLDELRARIVEGNPVDPAAIEGWAYRGTSLGLPRAVERLTWKTFQKTFYREPRSGRLLGWNVRLEQDGIDAPSRPKLRDGRPITEWSYEVIPPAGVPTPPGFDRGLIIDYSLAENPRLAPVRFMKDPLVALSPGNADELIGVSYLVVGGRCVETPTYFTLERDHPIEHVPLGAGAAAPRRSPVRLLPLERAWAEALFAAILGTGREEGLPEFQEVDRATFWRCFEEAAPPLIGMGLRGMVHTLTWLPLTDRRFRRPFFRLTPEERERFVAGLADDERDLVRQSLVTLKTLACFAYLDDAAVRARFERAPRAAEAGR